MQDDDFDFDAPTSEPTTDFSRLVEIAPTTVFDLDEETGNVVIVEPPIGDSTVVRLEISYIVEAFVNETEVFETDIDAMIFVTSVMASLGATNRGALDQVAPSRRLESLEATEFYKRRQLLSSSSFQRKYSQLVFKSCRLALQD